MRGTHGPVSPVREPREGTVAGTGPLSNCTKPLFIAPVPFAALIVGVRADPQEKSNL